jgi:hypothetical protein
MTTTVRTVRELPDEIALRYSCRGANLAGEVFAGVQTQSELSSVAHQLTAAAED